MDQVPGCPVFTRAKNKLPCWIKYLMAPVPIHFWMVARLGMFNLLFPTSYPLKWDKYLMAPSQKKKKLLQEPNLQSSFHLFVISTPGFARQLQVWKVIWEDTVATYNPGACPSGCRIKNLPSHDSLTRRCLCWLLANWIKMHVRSDTYHKERNKAKTY